MSCASWLIAITAKLAPPLVPTKNVDAAEKPPPAGGLETVTSATPALAMSVELIDACKLVLERNIVVRALPFHCTVEDGEKFFPVTVSVKLALPITAEPGFSNVIAGEGTFTAKLTASDIPPIELAFMTITPATPAVAMSVALIAACNSVFETNVVGRELKPEPRSPVGFHSTVDEGRKFVPVTVNTNAAPPATAELGLSAVIVGGPRIVSVRVLEVPPPGAGVKTVIVAVPGLAKSDAVTVNTKLVAELTLVVRTLPFH